MADHAYQDNGVRRVKSLAMIRLYDIMKANKKAKMGLLILSILLLVAIFAPFLTSYDPNERMLDMMSAPSYQHLLGTGDLGRDLFSLIIWGTQVSLFVGFVIVAISLIV